MDGKVGHWTEMCFMEERDIGEVQFPLLLIVWELFIFIPSFETRKLALERFKWEGSEKNPWDSLVWIQAELEKIVWRLCKYSV